MKIVTYVYCRNRCFDVILPIDFETGSNRIFLLETRYPLVSKVSIFASCYADDMRCPSRLGAGSKPISEHCENYVQLGIAESANYSRKPSIFPDECLLSLVADRDCMRSKHLPEFTPFDMILDYERFLACSSSILVY